MTEGVELLNQDKIKTTGEKNYKCLAIFEADTIKQVEMKENIFKNISGDREIQEKNKREENNCFNTLINERVVYLDIATKEKSLERSWIFSNCSTK